MAVLATALHAVQLPRRPRRRDRSGDREAGFQEISGIATELAVTEYRVGNAPHNNVIKLTGLNKAADVTFKRGIINPKVLFDWLNEIREGNPAARRTVTVELQGENHRTVATWMLNEARPLKYSPGPLNAKRFRHSPDDVPIFGHCGRYSVSRHKKAGPKAGFPLDR